MAKYKWAVRGQTCQRQLLPFFEKRASIVKHSRKASYFRHRVISPITEESSIEEDFTKHLASNFFPNHHSNNKDSNNRKRVNTKRRQRHGIRVLIMEKWKRHRCLIVLLLLVVLLVVGLGIGALFMGVAKPIDPLEQGPGRFTIQICNMRMYRISSHNPSPGIKPWIPAENV